MSEIDLIKEKWDAFRNYAEWTYSKVLEYNKLLAEAPDHVEVLLHTVKELQKRIRELEKEKAAMRK